jgi:hypothetical protein
MDLVAGHAGLSRVVFLHIDLREVGAPSHHHPVASGAKVPPLRFGRQERRRVVDVLLSGSVATLARHASLDVERSFNDVRVAVGTGLMPCVDEFQGLDQRGSLNTVEPLGPEPLGNHLASKGHKGTDEDDEAQSESNNLRPHMFTSTDGRFTRRREARL